jgi:hypothetical protein
VKRFYYVFFVFVFVLSFIGCDNPASNEPQKYDMIGYIVTPANYALCEEQITAYGGGEPTEAILDQFESWIIQNASPTLDTPIRNKTKEELVDALLVITSYSRSQLNTLFEKADSIGKYFSIGILSNGNREILFFDKLQESRRTIRGLPFCSRFYGI